MKLLKRSLFELDNPRPVSRYFKFCRPIKSFTRVDPSSPALTKLFDQRNKIKGNKKGKKIAGNKSSRTKLGLQPPNKGGNDGLKLFSH